MARRRSKFNHGHLEIRRPYSSKGNHWNGDLFLHFGDRIETFTQCVFLQFELFEACSCNLNYLKAEVLHIFLIHYGYLQMSNKCCVEKNVII